MTLLLETPMLAEAAHPALPIEETLVELLDLRLQAEHAHWRFDGTDAKWIHRFLDGLILQYRDWHHEVAAHLAVMCPSAELHVETIAAVTPLKLLPEGQLSGRDAVEFFGERVERVCNRVRARAEAIESQDPASGQLLDEIACELGDHGGMLRENLASRQRLAAVRGRSAASPKQGGPDACRKN